MFFTLMLVGNGLILFIILLLCLNSLICDSTYNLKSNKKSKIKGKVVNGKIVDIEEYPFAVQFLNIGRLCGGAIIHSWAIVTAAHCLEVNSDTEKMIIIAGAKYVYDMHAQRHDVYTFVMHEDYSKEQMFSCDIALVFPEKPIQFGTRAQRAILVNSDKWMNEREDNFNAIGWGYTQEDGDVSEVGLQMVPLKYVTPEECSRLHDDYKFTKDMFCLYGKGERDVCKGDSGGAVVWNDMVVGLTSHGKGCALVGKPSIFTNLWVLRCWIKKHVKAFYDDYCQHEVTKKRKHFTPINNLFE